MKQYYNRNLSQRNRLIWEKFQKFQQRIQQKIADGSFNLLHQKKQHQLLKTLRRYAQRLQQAGVVIRGTAGALALSLALSTSVQGQTFMELTGANNPFDGISIGGEALAFVDIDNDGDFDAFSGSHDGTVKYYKNTGTNVSPTFVEQTGGNNPFNGVDIGFQSSVFLVDIDNDDDFDAFIGDGFGEIKYYKNTGTNVSPTFTEQTGSNNPLDGVTVSGYAEAIPSFVDIDNDGDFDALLGTDYGVIDYYKNTGTNVSPTFTKQTGGNNPLNSVNLGGNGDATPSFGDIDRDGDFDVLIGSENPNGDIKFYKNTGTNVNPIFVEQTGGNNPFSSINLGTYYQAAPAFVDIDNDGDFDVFIIDGYNDVIKYYQNTTPLPVELRTFTAEVQENQTNLLKWQTTSEENNKGFYIEHSLDGENWETLDFIQGNGTTLETQNYTYTDENPIKGINYYRLKQIDFDGQFEYSEMVNVNNEIASEKYDLKIFPNPVKEELNIVSGQGQATIYNVLGQAVMQFIVNSEQFAINTSDLIAGQYILHIQKDNGVIVTQQFLK